MKGGAESEEDDEGYPAQHPVSLTVLSTILCIDPGVDQLGWSVYGPGIDPARPPIASGTVAVPGVDPSERITQAARTVDARISHYRPVLIVLEYPDKDGPMGVKARATQIRGFEAIEQTIKAAGVQIHPVSARDNRKELNHELSANVLAAWQRAMKPTQRRLGGVTFETQR